MEPAAIAAQLAAPLPPPPPPAADATASAWHRVAPPERRDGLPLYERFYVAALAPPRDAAGARLPWQWRRDESAGAPDALGKRRLVEHVDNEDPVTFDEIGAFDDVATLARETATHAGEEPRRAYATDQVFDANTLAVLVAGIHGGGEAILRAWNVAHWSVAPSALPRDAADAAARDAREAARAARGDSDSDSDSDNDSDDDDFTCDLCEESYNSNYTAYSIYMRYDEFAHRELMVCELCDVTQRELEDGTYEHDNDDDPRPDGLREDGWSRYEAPVTHLLVLDSRNDTLLVVQDGTALVTVSAGAPQDWLRETRPRASVRGGIGGDAVSLVDGFFAVARNARFGGDTAGVDVWGARPGAPLAIAHSLRTDVAIAGTYPATVLNLGVVRGSDGTTLLAALTRDGRIVGWHFAPNAGGVLAAPAFKVIARPFIAADIHDIDGATCFSAAGDAAASMTFVAQMKRRAVVVHVDAAGTRVEHLAADAPLLFAVRHGASPAPAAGIVSNQDTGVGSGALWFYPRGLGSAEGRAEHIPFAHAVRHARKIIFSSEDAPRDVFAVIGINPARGCTTMVFSRQSDQTDAAAADAAVRAHAEALARRSEDAAYMSAGDGSLRADDPHSLELRQRAADAKGQATASIAHAVRANGWERTTIRAGGDAACFLSDGSIAISRNHVVEVYVLQEGGRTAIPIYSWAM